MPGTNNNVSPTTADLIAINTDLQSELLKLTTEISELKSSNSSLKSELTKIIHSMKK